MRVRDHFAKEIIDIALNGESVTFDYNGKPVPCYFYEDGDCCNRCRFKTGNIKNPCYNGVRDYANSEYHEPILDEKEKEFLGYMVKHIKPEIITFKLRKYGDEKRYIAYRTVDEEPGSLPTFNTGTMYKNMEVDRWYTSEELGL